MKMHKNEIIHVLYALSDGKETYSKYVGTSICSVLENTYRKVMFYIFHDGTLSADNKKKFDELVGRYNQKIKYINVRKEAGDICEEAKSIFSHAMQEEARYPESAMYRLLAPSLLPDVKRLIYLDADTIINLEIAQLWEENLHDSCIGVITEKSMLEFYGQFMDENGLQEPIIKKMNGVTLANTFNSGVLLMDLEKMRSYGDILISGVKFLAKYPGESKFFDQDILVYHFATSAQSLDRKYNVLLHWERKYSKPCVKKAIYHYMGHALAMNDQDVYDVLFYDYFIKTPWFSGKLLCYICKSQKSIINSNVAPVWRTLNTAVKLMMSKRPVIVYEQASKGALCDYFTGETTGNLREYLHSRNIGALEIEHEGNMALNLQYDIDEYLYILFVNDYKKIAAILTKAGMKENVNFIDGKLLLNKDDWLKYIIIEGLFFSVI